jgi:flagellar biosynthesis/type III secretory pathway protein FliH
MTDILLSPQDIVTSLSDSGEISKGTAVRLEQRITAWAESQKAEGRRDGILEAARRAKYVVAGIKSAGQRAAAEKVLRAIQRLLAHGDEARKEAYERGYKDGVTEQRRKPRDDKQPVATKENG